MEARRLSRRLSDKFLPRYTLRTQCTFPALTIKQASEAPLAFLNALSTSTGCAHSSCPSQTASKRALGTHIHCENTMTCPRSAGPTRSNQMTAKLRTDRL